MASLLARALISMVVLAAFGCGRPRSDAHISDQQVRARCSVAVAGATLIVSAIDRGLDFRVVQGSRRIDLVARWRDDQTGPEIAEAVIAPNGEWFDGTNLAAALSVDESMLYLFRQFPQPIEGKLVFRKDLGVNGGWYLVPRDQLPPEDVARYRYALLGAVSTVDKQVFGVDDLQRLGFIRGDARLSVDLRIRMNGEEVPVREVEVHQLTAR